MLHTVESFTSIFNIKLYESYSYFSAEMCIYFYIIVIVVIVVIIVLIVMQVTGSF